MIVEQKCTVETLGDVLQSQTIAITYMKAMMGNLTCSYYILVLHIVFAQSDTAATIYFIAQFCVASIRERRLLNSVFSVKFS